MKDTDVTEVKAGVETGRRERLMFAGFSVRAKEAATTCRARLPSWTKPSLIISL